ncbi:MAG: hypothetical protein IJZ22_07770 [Bacteroidaceae bacterium]|nr:hypothetical protein [Bacteroidaceae bacterium]
MNIVIDKNEIVCGLHKMSAHLGVKLSAPELVASTPDDEEKITVMLQASSVELLKLLSPYATFADGADAYTYLLEMPVNWKVGQMGNLVNLCKMYMQYSLFARWLDFVKSDSAMLYRTLNAETASAIVHILSLREKPVRE